MFFNLNAQYCRLLNFDPLLIQVIDLDKMEVWHKGVTFECRKPHLWNNLPYHHNFHCLIYCSQLNLLKEAVVRGKKICSAGPRHNLSMKCPNLRELDVSKTLLPSWEEVARITTQLTHLTSLNVRYVLNLRLFHYMYKVILQKVKSLVVLPENKFGLIVKCEVHAIVPFQVDTFHSSIDA